MKKAISVAWQEALEPEFSKQYFKELSAFIEQEYAQGEVFPPRELIFNALNRCPLDKVKVVIIGQDPYHDVGQAHGLCFSVADGVKIPPSLVNIFKEIERDLSLGVPSSGNLERWAEQGVLMLNAVLTVRAHQAASHAKRGWEKFTDAVVKAVAENRIGVVYMLWGKYAQSKCAVVDPTKNLILQSVHPSPLSAYRGFFGCSHFSQANEYLASQGDEPIEWGSSDVQATLFD
ncbi:MAG: uracil-DNA glycosylase [Rikenellaceae bacterium]